MKALEKIMAAITIPAVLVTFWGLARLAQGTATYETIEALIIAGALTVISIIFFEGRRYR